MGLIMAGSAKQTRHDILLKDQFGQTVLILPTGTTSTRFAKKLGTSRVEAATLPKEGRRVVGWMLRSPGRFQDLPVKQPMKSEIMNELKAARALGLTIPQSLLLRAEEVFQ
jgi:hypothetical protein